MLPALLALSLNPPPNLIYIMADDLGYGDLGCYGQEKIPTPHLDRMAREGMRFTRGYSASGVCAPTRYSLLTGKHQGKAAIRGNKEAGPGFGPNAPEGQMPMPAKEATLPEVLRKAGYRTGLVGKWGLGGPRPGEFPNDHGFDHFYGYLCQRRAHNFYPVYLWKNTEPQLLENPFFSPHQRIAEPLATEDEYYQRYGGKGYAPEKMAEECVRFIRESRQPFYLYYAPTLPHVALQAPKEWVDRFPREWDAKPYLGQSGYLPNPRPRATYAAMVAYLDHTVGLILHELRATGKDRNTLVIFTSDNGAVRVAGGADPDFFRSNGDLREGKMSLWEGGIRVPYLAWQPGRIPAGKTSGRTITAYDAPATFAEAAGVRMPKADGVSYLPTLTGKAQTPRSFAYFEYPESTAMQAVMWGPYKAIRPDLKSNPDRLHVYDLESDPSERNDLAPARPDLVRQAMRLFQREHRPNRDFPLGKIDPT